MACLKQANTVITIAKVCLKLTKNGKLIRTSFSIGLKENISFATSRISIDSKATANYAQTSSEIFTPTVKFKSARSPG